MQNQCFYLYLSLEVWFWHPHENGSCNNQNIEDSLCVKSSKYATCKAEETVFVFYLYLYLYLAALAALYLTLVTHWVSATFEL